MKDIFEFFLRTWKLFEDEPPIVKKLMFLLISGSIASLIVVIIYGIFFM